MRGWKEKKHNYPYLIWEWKGTITDNRKGET